MTNVTLSLPEDVARWARVEAAERNLSLSKMLSLILADQMELSNRYDVAMEAFLQRKPMKLKEDGSYPSRDELHER
ncbi:MAG: hypothetical protein ACYTGH_14190 [Planctomycetota bacterium]|jgi:hypothetical protein